MNRILPLLALCISYIGALAAIEEPSLIQLEEKIVQSLKNSWCSEAKAKLILEYVVTHRPQVCVEIGAFTGSSTLPMLAGLQHLNQGCAFVIDPWSNEEAIRGLPEGDPNTLWWCSLDMKEIRNLFDKTIADWSFKPYLCVLPMSSEEAASRIPPINFLHLDGNFSEPGALLDTQLYLPKVTPGGYILISNVLTMIDKRATKMKALWPLFESCEIVKEIENGNALLFMKKIE